MKNLNKKVDVDRKVLDAEQIRSIDGATEAKISDASNPPGPCALRRVDSEGDLIFSYYHKIF